MTEPAPAPAPAHGSAAGDLGAVARLALRLGLTAFGGPAAHVALLRDEVVTRRAWFTDAAFADLLGATNLIPGPNSTELVMHTGMARAGPGGLVVAGTLFILPAAAITLGFAWAYEAYGTAPAVDWLLSGVKPVVVAVIAQAIWGLGRATIKAWWALVLAVAALALAALGVDEIALLLGAGLIVAAARGATRLRGRAAALVLAALPPGDLPWSALLAATAAPVSYDPATLFWTLLKIGATLYGSGYVLIAFLNQDFVERLGWLTGQQLLDAVAVGQFTPGPVFSTATFVGYLVGGWGGAVLATVAIFLPAFVFVGLTHRLVPRVRANPIAGGFLDGVNVAAVALMAAVLWSIGRDALVDAPSVALALAAAVLLIRFKVNSVWLILGGAAAGFALAGLPAWLA